MPSLTITVDAGQAARMEPAFTHLLNLAAEIPPRTATVADVKAYLVKHMAGIVVNYERQVANQAVPDPSEFNPT